MNYTLQDFFALFQYENFTLQFFEGEKPRGVSFLGRTDMLKHLSSVQAPIEAFFMVNQGDGQRYGKNKTCRSQASVTSLNSCFLDTDSCPLDRVKEYLRTRPELKPHAVIETSPGKFHFYFCILPVPKTEVNLSRWKAVQAALCYFSNPEKKPTGCDPSMVDHSRVLRIPGFVHRKSGFTTRIALLSNHTPYLLEHLAQLTDAAKFQGPAASSTIMYTVPTEPLPQGGRHYDMASFLAHLLNRGVSREMAMHCFYGHASRTYENHQDFLPGGKRHDEVTRFVQYHREKEEHARVETAQRVLGEADTGSEIGGTLSDGGRSAADRFNLPDHFYHELPGLAGEIVKEIDKTAYIQNPPFTWAATIAALGSLKAVYTESSLGHAPSNYFLCLAPTGTGKNYAIETFQNTFSKLGLSYFLQSKLRSDQGLLRFLAENHNAGLILSDEAEYFLSMLDNKTAPAYIRNCKAMLLELYTSTHKANVSFGLIGDKKQQPVVLNRPRLNFVGYGVIGALDNVFSENSIQDGLLQRFVVITDFRNVKRNEQYKPATALNGTCFSQLNDLRWKMKLKCEGNLLAIQDAQSSAEAEPDKEKRAALLAEVKRMQAWAQSDKKQIIKFTPDAESLYQKYAQDLMNKRNSTKNQVFSGLYTRAAEQVGRMACAVADQTIDANLIDYLVSFMDTRINALHEYCAENLAAPGRGTNLKRDLSDLQQCIARLQKKSHGQPVPYREIARSYKIRNARELRDLLSAAVEADQIVQHENYRADSATVGRKGTAYSLAM